MPDRTFDVDHVCEGSIAFWSNEYGKPGFCRGNVSVPTPPHFQREVSTGYFA